MPRGTHLLTAVAVLFAAGWSYAGTSVVHSTSTDFAGSYSQTENVGSPAAPAIKLTYSIPYNFGNGHDGAATLSGDPNARATCSGSAGSKTLSSSLNPAAGDLVLIHQSRGSGAGNWEINKVVSATTSAITLENALFTSYSGSAQVVLVPQYTNVTITGGGPAAWNGSTGGIYAIYCTGTATISGTLSANAAGFAGGYRPSGNNNDQGRSGESYSGLGSDTTNRNNGGGGGGRWCNNGQQYAGGGGAYGANGSNGTCENCCGPGYGGYAYGSSDLSTIYFGSGGGSYGVGWGNRGGNGGGIVFIQARNIVNNGGIASQGSWNTCGGGAGSGGALFLRTLGLSGSGWISANGFYGNQCGWSIDPGDGGAGRVRVDYVTANGYSHGNGSATSYVNTACTPDPGSTALVAFDSTGTYTSQPVALTNCISMGTISWVASGGTSVKFRTRTSADGSNWSAWSSDITVSGTTIPSAPNNYLQYEATLTGSSTSSPSLSRVEITYNVPSAPSRMRPAEGVYVGTTTPMFAWDASVDPVGLPLSYHVVVSANSDLSNPIIDQQSDSNGAATRLISGTALTDGNTYYWRASVTNGNDTTASAIQSFTVDTSIAGNAVKHLLASQFDAGTFNDTEQLGSGATPAVQIARGLPFKGGDGRDGAATINWDPNTRASLSGNAAAGATAIACGLTVTSGDIIIIHQSRGTNAGAWEMCQVSSSNGSTIYLQSGLVNNYYDNGGTNACQVVRVPQYTSLTIAGSGPAAWNYNTGGIYAVMCSGTVTISGTLAADGTGYRGGYRDSGGERDQGRNGETYSGTGWDSTSYNNGGGGAGRWCDPNAQYGGAGGGHAGWGTNGTCDRCCGPAYGGSPYGVASLTTMFFGSGGGSYGVGWGNRGGDGGGIVYIQGRNVNITGTVSCRGSMNCCGGGLGAGGSVYIRAVDFAASGSVNATGLGGNPCGWSIDPGDGSNGRIRVDYSTAGGYAYGHASATTLVNNVCAPDPGSTSLPPYLTTGTYSSATIDTAGCTDFGTLSWTVASGSAVFETRSSTDGANWSEWSSVSGSGEAIGSPAGDYLQYRATLSGTSSVTPVLSAVVATYSTVVPPTITMNPESQSLCPGTSPTFSVAANTGGGELSYQWTKDGSNITDGSDYADTTTDTLTVLNITAADAGNYACVVSNSAGSATSSAATLSVNAGPTIAGANPIAVMVVKGSICTDTANQVALAGSDPELDGLSWSIVGGPAHGLAEFLGASTGNAVTLCYEPAAGYLGMDTLTVRLADTCNNYDEVTVNIDVQESPMITAWESVSVHGSTELPVVLNPELTGLGEAGPVVDPRATGIAKLAVNFNMPVRPTSGSIETTTVEVIFETSSRTSDALILSGDGRRLEAVFDPPLSGLQRYSIDLTDKFERAAEPHLQLVGQTTCQVRTLEGDVTGDGNVTLLDVAAIRSRNRAPVNADNARYDLNADGAINLIDMALARNRTGQSVP